MWTTPATEPHTYALGMELALTLLSIASFFVLVLAWTVLPASKAIISTTPSVAPSPQAAH